MKWVMAVALLALAGCGENVDSQLAGCKGEMRNQLKTAMEEAKQEIAKAKAAAVRPDTPKEVADMAKKAMEMGDAFPQMFEKVLLPAVEAEMAKWQGEDGLAKCRQQLAQSKDMMAKLKAVR